VTDDVAVRLDPLADTDIGWITAACQDPEIQRWTVVDLRPVGMIAIHTFDAKTGVADIGYWVAPWGRRQGIARGAIKLLIEEIRGIAGAGAVQARIAITNTASRRTVESCAFTLVEVSSTLTCPDGTNTVAAAVYGLNL